MLTVRPIDIHELPAIRASMRPAQFMVQTRQIASGLSWLISWHDRPFAACGLVPLDPATGEQADEIWLMMADHLPQGADRAAAVRAMIARFRATGFARPILAAIRDGWRPGEVMARRMGFVKALELQVFPPTNYWVHIPRLTRGDPDYPARHHSATSVANQEHGNG